MTPDFDEALDAFRPFLAQQGWPDRLTWVFREDVAAFRRRRWVRLPLAEDNEDLARAYFQYGQRQARGVTLEAFCAVEGLSACFVWVPQDDQAASYAMQKPLGLKLPASSVEAGVVRWAARWKWIKWSTRLSGNGWLSDQLPSRAEALAWTSSVTGLAAKRHGRVR